MPAKAYLKKQIKKRAAAYTADSCPYSIKSALFYLSKFLLKQRQLPTMIHNCLRWQRRALIKRFQHLACSGAGGKRSHSGTDATIHFC